MNIIKGTAAHECISEEALIHLTSYKYSSVDRSLLSYYILNPYVRTINNSLPWENSYNRDIVERFRRITSIMAGSQHGDPHRVLLHHCQCSAAGDIYARPGGAGKRHSLRKIQMDHVLEAEPGSRVRHGCIIASLSGCGCERTLGIANLETRADRTCYSRYQTMDNIDGKQARRTGQSSGLGELFEYVEYQIVGSARLLIQT